MKHNPEGYAAVLAVVRSAWALVDNTAYHDWLPLTVSRDDWNDLVADLNRLKALIPPDELPAEPPHAVTCLWPRCPTRDDQEQKGGGVSEQGASSDYILLCQRLAAASAIWAIYSDERGLASICMEEAAKAIPTLLTQVETLTRERDALRKGLKEIAALNTVAYPAEVRANSMEDVARSLLHTEKTEGSDER